MLFLKSNILPELQPYHLEERDLRKRAKFLQKTKDAMWNRWTAEYLRALRELYRLKHGDKRCSLAVGDVVIIKSSERPLGIFESLIDGKDGAVRGPDCEPADPTSNALFSTRIPWNCRATGVVSEELQQHLTLEHQCLDPDEMQQSPPSFECKI